MVNHIRIIIFGQRPPRNEVRQCGLDIALKDVVGREYGRSRPRILRNSGLEGKLLELRGVEVKIKDFNTTIFRWTDDPLSLNVSECIPVSKK